MVNKKVMYMGALFALACNYADANGDTVKQDLESDDVVLFADGDPVRFVTIDDNIVANDADSGKVLYSLSRGGPEEHPDNKEVKLWIE